MDKDSISISQTLSEETILSLNCKDKISPQVYINRQNWHTYSTPQFHPVSKLDGDSF